MSLKPNGKSDGDTAWSLGDCLAVELSYSQSDLLRNRNLCLTWDQGCRWSLAMGRGAGDMQGKP